ncbi:MAG: DUF2148 domain-containing protein [Spirochaetia bacterium]|jgi:uncharacterized ferredoxin-like protein
MKTEGITLEIEGIMETARAMCVAARTAPKAHGADNLFVALLTGEEKEEVVTEMRRIGETPGAAFFVRDANNVHNAEALVLIGTRIKTLGIPACGFCGFKDCKDNEKHGAVCAFNTNDLGIAVGSAVSVAADRRVDSRVMFSAGRAAVNLHSLGVEVRVALGIPLSASGKSPFFDRK